MNAAERIAFAGEQVLSFLDEITRLPCPRCHEQTLTPTIVGANLVIRCSEVLQDYNSCESTTEVPVLEGVCDYIQVVKPTSVHMAPFNFKFTEGRATQKNVPKRRGRRPKAQ